MVKLTNTMSPADIRTKLLAPTFPVHKMTELLDHDNHQMRADFRKFISVPVFWNNPLRIFAAHELAAIIDPAMTTKMTVQFNLFGGTVLKLGTERHHKELIGWHRQSGRHRVFWP